ncbi:MAG TPA: hypothetical protein HA263_03355 [Methanoregulaceae archaeon]|nr:hypothetical protein [Methanoregulaceae archaeon]
MAPDDADLLARADELGDALKRAKQVMDPGAFYHLLVESNATIRQVTRVEYGTICAPPTCGCGGTC